MPGIDPIPYNAYSSWKEIAESATYSLIIFTPFLDSMVTHLFEECPLPWNKLGLVTQNDWEEFSSQSIKKDNVIDELIDNGVEVRYLPRLHAKAIVADWERAVIGSQNFTHYSQDSYEVSFQLDRNAEGAELDQIFFRLEEWWEEAGELLDLDDTESEDED
jgi:hypothetical protein